MKTVCGSIVAFGIICAAAFTVYSLIFAITNKDFAVSIYDNHIISTCNRVALPGENYDIIAMKYHAASMSLFLTLLSLTIYASISCGGTLAKLSEA
jgi:hypothetical protein